MRVKIFILICLSAFAARAVEELPSESLIREVLAVSSQREDLEDAILIMEPQFTALAKRKLSERKIEIVDKTANDILSVLIVRVLHEQLSYDKMELLYIKAYQEIFTKDEIEFILASKKAGKSPTSDWKTAPIGAEILKKDIDFRARMASAYEVPSGKALTEVFLIVDEIARRTRH